MKRVAAISLLLVLSLLQYGKFMGYIQCNIRNAVTTGAPCDCEKQWSHSISKNTPTLPADKKATLAPEEFESPSTQHTQILSFNNIVPQNGRYNDHYAFSFAHTPYQPPPISSHI